VQGGLDDLELFLDDVVQADLETGGQVDLTRDLEMFGEREELLFALGVLLFDLHGVVRGI
jgi:hypothetical protein